MRFDDALAWIGDAYGYADDPPLPADLHDGSVLVLTEGRGHLGSAGSTAYGLRRRVDQEIVRAIGPYGAIRYGDSLLRVTRDAVRYIVDPAGWWRLVAEQVTRLGPERGAELLARLYNASHVRMRGLSTLAEASGLDEQALRGTFIDYRAGRSTHKIEEPRRADWPGWAEAMRDGEVVDTSARWAEVSSGEAEVTDAR